MQRKERKWCTNLKEVEKDMEDEKEGMKLYEYCMAPLLCQMCFHSNYACVNLQLQVSKRCIYLRASLLFFR